MEHERDLYEHDLIGYLAEIGTNYTKDSDAAKETREQLDQIIDNLEIEKAAYLSIDEAINAFGIEKEIAGFRAGFQAAIRLIVSEPKNMA